jgi:hypothetical protein
MLLKTGGNPVCDRLQGEKFSSLAALSSSDLLLAISGDFLPQCDVQTISWTPNDFQMCQSVVFQDADEA